MSVSKLISTTIHVERAKKRISQQELADSIGVSRQSIMQLEKGKYNPSLLLANDIAKYFGLQIEDIFFFEKQS